MIRQHILGAKRGYFPRSSRRAQRFSLTSFVSFVYSVAQISVSHRNLARLRAGPTTQNVHVYSRNDDNSDENLLPEDADIKQIQSVSQ